MNLASHVATLPLVGDSILAGLAVAAALFVIIKFRRRK